MCTIYALPYTSKGPEQKLQPEFPTPGLRDYPLHPSSLLGLFTIEHSSAGEQIFPGESGERKFGANEIKERRFIV